MDDLLQEFIAETRETLDALSGEIVAWEASPDDRARLDAIFRFVHTVKGSCGFLDLPRLLRLSHAAEDVLSDVRSGARQPDRALVDAVLAIVDRIGAIIEAIDAGTPLDDSGEELLIAALAVGADVAMPNATPVAGATGSRGAQRSVRLNVDLLDRMMGGMSDMVLARNELARRLRDQPLDPVVEAALERMSASVAEMRDTVTRTRMQKIDALFAALPRMVRDTAAAVGKAVTLHVDGSDVELDREMIEVMRDPLMHLVRNAIDHGLETPQQRRAAGKREAGRLDVSARQSGNQIVVEIVDDGRGIDTDRLVAKLVGSGHRRTSELASLSERQRCELIFEPGLSSRDDVTEISGRGVGMDVVKAAVDAIGGRIALDSRPGRGLRVSMQIPLTLSIISTLVVEAGGQRFAIPRQAIGEIVTERGGAIRIDEVGGTSVAAVREQRIAVADLAGLIGAGALRRRGDRLLVIVSTGQGSYGLAVDAVLDTEELVVKPACPVIMAAGIYAGQTLPDNGCPTLLLDCAGVAQVAGIQFDSSEPRDEEDDEDAAADGVQALLFVDLDGCRRVLPLAAIDRIERAPVAAFRDTGDRCTLSIDGRIVPARCNGTIATEGDVAVLRLTDGVREIAYAIDDAVDIVTLPEAMVPLPGDGPVAGAVLIDGEQVEQIDPYWLFARIDAQTASSLRPLCLLSGDDGWMQAFLRPVVEQAGYRAVTRVNSGERPALVLTQSAEPPPVSPGTHVVRLRTDVAEAGDGTVYRYDRTALVAAIAAGAKGEAA